MSVRALRPVSEEPLISMADVAARLGVPLETLRRWRKHGRGPKGYRLGKHVHFRWSEVETWLQQRHEQPDEPTGRITNRKPA